MIFCVIFCNISLLLLLFSFCFTLYFLSFFNLKVLARANLDPSVLGLVKGHVDDVLQQKNAETRKLQAEVARLQALQEQLNTSVGNKMKEYGLSVSELGYVVPGMVAKQEGAKTLTKR